MGSVDRDWDIAGRHERLAHVPQCQWIVVDCRDPRPLLPSRAARRFGRAADSPPAYVAKRYRSMSGGTATAAVPRLSAAREDLVVHVLRFTFGSLDPRGQWCWCQMHLWTKNTFRIARSAKSGLPGRSLRQIR